MGLSKRAHTGVSERILMNVYCIVKKEIVFTGGAAECANFMGIPQSYIYPYLKSKTRIKKKWAIRMAKEEQKPTKQ